MADRKRCTIVLSEAERDELVAWLENIALPILRVAPMSDGTRLAIHRIKTARVATFYSRK